MSVISDRRDVDAYHLSPCRKEHDRLGPILDDKVWFRHGRGRTFTLFITDDELVDILDNCLPEEYAPYSFEGCLFDIEDSTAHLHESFALQQFREMRKNACTECNLRSRTVTPSFPVKGGGRTILTLCHLNGFINIMHGARHRQGHVYDTIIGMADKVWNSETGEVWEYTAYFAIFNALKKALKKVTKKVTLRPGLENIVISQGMLQRYEAGDVSLTSRFQYDPQL